MASGAEVAEEMTAEAEAAGLVVAVAEGAAVEAGTDLLPSRWAVDKARADADLLMDFSMDSGAAMVRLLAMWRPSFSFTLGRGRAIDFLLFLNF